MEKNIDYKANVPKVETMNSRKYKILVISMTATSNLLFKPDIATLWSKNRITA